MLESLERIAEKRYLAKIARNPYRQDNDKMSNLYAMLMELAEDAKQRGVYQSLNMRDKARDDKATRRLGVEIASLFDSDDDVIRSLRIITKNAWRHGVRLGDKLNHVEKPSNFFAKERIPEEHRGDLESYVNEPLELVNRAMHDILSLAFSNVPTLTWSG